MGLIRQSLRAKADLQQLRRRSEETFGLARTLRYAQELQHELERLSDGYPHGVMLSGLAPDVLRYRVESHYVYFRRITGGIEVSRVLHTKQMAALHVFPRSDHA